MKNILISILATFIVLAPVKAQCDQPTPQEIAKWKTAAKQGNAPAQFNIGLLHATGQGLRQDYGEAMKWYKLAAEQGNAGAQLNIGNMYAIGQGIEQDYEEAMKWYKLAADKGNAIAQHNVGLMYATGQGASQDYGEAMKWYKLAAEQGDDGGGEGDIAVGVLDVLGGQAGGDHQQRQVAHDL